jgi:hypothetical protein
MQFLAYILVVLVSLGGILVELDWLTKPKLDTKSPVQAASTAVPARTVPKVDGPTEGPTPVVTTKKPEAEQANAAPPAANNSVPAETTGAAPADQVAVAPPVNPAPVQPIVTNAKADTAPPQAAQPQMQATTNVAAPPLAQPQAQPQAQAPTASPQPVQAVAKQAPNSCDVQGCASAYQSFRASDCTYQPMEGPRKFCEKPPAANQRITSAPRDPRLEPTVRRPSRDAELRDVERAVRSIRVGDQAGYDSRNEPRMGRGDVIVIERPERDW